LLLKVHLELHSIEKKGYRGHSPLEAARSNDFFLRQRSEDP
jgi:hypothetical protein